MYRCSSIDSTFFCIRYSLQQTDSLTPCIGLLYICCVENACIYAEEGWGMLMDTQQLCDLWSASSVNDLQVSRMLAYCIFPPGIEVVAFCSVNPPVHL